MTPSTLAPAASCAAARSARTPSYGTVAQRRDAAVAAARSASGGRLSAAQKAEVEAIFERVEARKANVPLSRFETVRIADLRTRLEARIVAAVKAAAASCGYRRSASGWAGGEHRTYVGLSGWVSAGGASEKVWHEKKAWSGTNSTHSFRVKPSWLRIQCQGLAVVDGLLTLDATPVADGLWSASWVEQARGFDLRVERGYIVRDYTGRLRHAPSEAAARKLQQAPKPKAEPKAPGKPRPTAADRAVALRVRLGHDLDAWAAFADVVVTTADSHKAGNCETGTRDWSHRWLDGATQTTVGAVLHALVAGDDRTTLALAACAYAIVRVGRDRAVRKAA